jgi:hypothetical protein
MFRILWVFLGTIRRLFCDRRGLVLENLVLRQQLAGPSVGIRDLSSV